MSDTYKDKPYYIRKANAAGKRLTKNEFWNVDHRWHPGNTEGEAIDNWLDETLPAEFYKTLDGVPAWFKRMKNRNVKAKTKAAMNRGEYDVLPMYVRNAAWEWF